MFGDLQDSGEIESSSFSGTAISKTGRCVGLLAAFSTLSGVRNPKSEVNPSTGVLGADTESFRLGRAFESDGERSGKLRSLGLVTTVNSVINGGFGGSLVGLVVGTGGAIDAVDGRACAVVARLRILPDGEGVLDSYITLSAECCLWRIGTGDKVLGDL